MQSYKKLFTYWYAVLIYDLTVEFCKRWIRSWKLSEQMTGAGRSGKQNITEGSDNMATSLKITIKLTGTAKGSLEELLGDYEDFLRQRKLAIWTKTDNRIRLFRGTAAKLVKDLSNLRNLRLPASQVEKKQRELFKKLPLPTNPETAANLLLTLCHQATYLLKKQTDSLIEKHGREGGFTEKLYWQRRRQRGY